MRSPVVEIDAGSGFCHGVVSAIRKAEEELARSSQLACLGDIVHNSDEVERLRQKGLDTITHDDLSRMSHCKVLLRAHGEPPSTYKTARERDIEIVDATCPVVLQLQRRIKKLSIRLREQLRLSYTAKTVMPKSMGLSDRPKGRRSWSRTCRDSVQSISIVI